MGFYKTHVAELTQRRQRAGLNTDKLSSQSDFPIFPLSAHVPFGYIYVYCGAD